MRDGQKRADLIDCADLAALNSIRNEVSRIAHVKFYYVAGAGNFMTWRVFCASVRLYQRV